MNILVQMPVCTEEATFPPAPGERAARAEGLSIAGVPWVTVALLLGCVWVLAAAGGIRSGVGLSGLLQSHLDRGETRRLFAANLLHKDPLPFAFHAFALWHAPRPLAR